MYETLNARELALQYVASQFEGLSEEEYLEKLVQAEARFTELLAEGPKDPLAVWQTLSQKG